MSNTNALPTEERIKAYWNKRQRMLDTTQRLYWYQHPQALRHYRDCVVQCDAPIGQKPIQCYLRTHYPTRTFRRGLSIGCGAGHKEIALVTAGTVERFDLFELSDGTIQAGRAEAARLGLQDRVIFHQRDVLRRGLPQPERYDLVHWDNALHHMFSAEDAIQFSRDVLSRGGVLVIDDYVGPSYMQVSEEVYAVADKVRAGLPEKYLRNNTPSSTKFPLIPKSPRIPKARFLATDPSEMADSSNVLPAARRHLPNVTIIPTGGVLFFLGLRPLFGNFDENDPTDRALLADLLMQDRTWTKDHPEATFHAFLCWEKP